jgi:hypothetical protein
VSFTRLDSGFYKINGVQFYDGNGELDNKIELQFSPNKISGGGFGPDRDPSYIIKEGNENFYLPIEKGGASDYIQFSIDKSIEWNKIAKEEKVAELSKDIPDENYVTGILSIYDNSSTANFPPYSLDTNFIIKEEKHWRFLLLTFGIYSIQFGVRERYVCIKDTDLPKFQEAFSEEFKQKILKADEDYRLKRESQASKFN